MKVYTIFFLSLFSLLLTRGSYAQFRKMDSTLKIGKAGYKVVCNNKSPDKNELQIRPVGFESTAREMDFYIKGRVTSTQIDDLNNDGFPDLVVFISGGGKDNYGTVYAFMSEENKSISPFGLPDAMLDGKLRDGYKGHDQFTLMEGMMMREFPIYKDGDAPDKPTGGKRVAQYNIVQGAAGYQFKLVSTHDVK